MSSHQETFVLQLRSSIIELLDSNEYNVETLCLLLSVSRSHLHRLVKEATGASISHYVREIRLDRAKLLLSRTDHSISEIAHSAGFKTAQNFSKYFTECYGISPSKYRSTLPGASINNDSEVPGEATNPTIIRIGVLPFINASSDKEQDYFVDGLTEEIQFRLSQTPTLKVAGRASAFYFKGTNLSLKKIADQLHVNYLIVGTVRKYDNILRIAIELIKVSNNDVIWTEIYESSKEAIFQIQDSIVSKVKSYLAPDTNEESSDNDSSLHKTNSVVAYEYYLKGRSEFALRADLDKALFYYEQAVAADPNFAHAYYGLAFTRIYGCIFSGIRPTDVLPQIEQAYKKAASLNPNTAEFYIIEGWINFYFYHDFEKSISSMTKAVEIDDESIEGYRIWAYFHCFRGQYDKAIPLAKKAYQLDPLGFNPWFSYADILRRSRRYNDALALFVPLKEKFPKHPLIEEITGLCYMQTNQMEQAGQIFEVSLGFPDNIALWTIGTYMFHHKKGDRSALQGLLDHLLSIRTRKWIQPTVLALINYHLGNDRIADNFMDEAVEELDFGLKHINSEPYWDRYRDYSKVKEVLEKVDFAIEE